MKIGDVVRYGKWYTGPPKVGIVIDGYDQIKYKGDLFFLVAWENHHEWEDACELEVVVEG